MIETAARTPGGIVDEDEDLARDVADRINEAETLLQEMEQNRQLLTAQIDQLQLMLEELRAAQTRLAARSIH
jgi:phage shock protein A